MASIRVNSGADTVFGFYPYLFDMHKNNFPLQSNDLGGRLQKDPEGKKDIMLHLFWIFIEHKLLF